MTSDNKVWKYDEEPEEESSAPAGADGDVSAVWGEGERVDAREGALAVDGEVAEHALRRCVHLHAYRLTDG